MALHFVHEDPASGSVASPSEREVEEKTSKSWPGHGLPLTASRLHASFPNALFGEDSEYVHWPFSCTLDEISNLASSLFLAFHSLRQRKLFA